MSATLAIVADDLTGAADAGAGFRRAGLATIVTWDPVEAALADRVDVVSIDADTRDAEASRAGSITRGVVAALRASSVGTLYKKIDSTLRGHVGVELHACLGDWHHGAVAIVAPAFPAAGRTTVDGWQRSSGVRVQPHSIDATLESHGVPTGHLNLRDVRSEALADAMKAAYDRGLRAVVCDAETDDDLRAIVLAGRRLTRPVIWTGTAGLAAAMADGLVARPMPEAALKVPVAAGPVLVVVGSTSDVARAQAAHVAASGTRRVGFPADVLADANGDAAAALAGEVVYHLRAHQDVLVTIDGDNAGANDNRLMTRLGEVLRSSAESVGALVITGGASAAAVLRPWQTAGLRLLGELEPGVPLSITIGPWTLPVVTKAGAFGTVETLERARAALSRSSRPAT
jgi:4-hydroxythreonine-4-phosphate dehydrogenase